MALIAGIGLGLGLLGSATAVVGMRRNRRSA
jgi:hypothetical protein